MKALPILLVGTLALAAACSKPAPEPVNGSNGPGPTASNRAQAAAAAATPKAAGPLASVLHPELLDPSKLDEKAPTVFKAKFETTKGDFVVEVHRDWAPHGADRFYNLVKHGFYDDTRFFRVIDGFMAQFGINGDPAVNAKWQNATIPDDPVKQPNMRGFVTFAMTSMPNSRSTQIFINYVDNSRLDGMGFAPFGQVTEGMNVVDQIYKQEVSDQGAIQARGNAFLDSTYPRLDGVKHAEIVAGS
jgi:peptidyl-prolyl cis-trans isomerase A (cyclophilin A)